MSRLRFTLAQLMALVLFCGFGFAALRNATPFWASATFSLAIVSVSAAFVGACGGKKKGRGSWAGFATTGGLRLVTWLLAGQTPGTGGPPTPLLYAFQPYINPMAFGGVPFIAYSQICYSLEVILLGLIGAAIGHFVAAKDARPSP